MAIAVGVAIVSAWRVHAGVGIIAVSVVADVVCWCRTSLPCIRWITIAITVGIAIEGCRDTFIYLSIAIVVEAVANFRCARVHICARVVAVGGVRDVSSRSRTRLGAVLRVSVSIAVG